MNYKPVRDIPKAVRELKTLSPTKICHWIREHRTENVGRLKKQCDRSPQSISHWFDRNKEVYETLKLEIQEEEIPASAISEALFQNGVFDELPIIKQWHKDLVGVSKNKVRDWTNRIKRVCKGNIRKIPKKEDIPEWGLKHPRNLTLQVAKDFIYELSKKGYAKREWALALRSFLASKGIVVKPTDISGALEEDAGQYADLFVSKPKIYETLAYIKNLNYEAWLACYFAYKTATRSGATLGAMASHVNMEEKTITVYEKSKRRKGKSKYTKIIPVDLWEELEARIKAGGKLFDIKEDELCDTCKRAYKEVIPQVAERIPMPFHFWRHMFAQHMLRASNWNYGLVASLGGWTVGALRRYYGKPPMEVIKEFGLKTLPSI